LRKAPKSCHVGIAILDRARTGSDPARQVFWKVGSRGRRDRGRRRISDGWMSCSRQPGVKEAQGPKLPYPAFNSRQSAMLLKRPWPEGVEPGRHSGHGDDDVGESNCPRPLQRP
jgi:hypothetical protein